MSTVTLNTAASETADAADAVVEPADRIGELRTAIDDCDAQLIELVQRRRAISQEIGELRASTGGMRLSLSRERQVLSRFRNVLGPDGASLGMMLLRQGRGRL